MPTIYTQSQDEFQVNAIDFVHINPSILEGVNQVSGILSPRSAIPIVRFAPNFTVNPSITGSPIIPSTLVCDPGVVTASPSPAYSYQWRQDGVDLVGQTSPTLVTDISMDTAEITCYVEAVNFLGMTSGLSNQITMSIVEAIELKEQGYMVITGLQQENQQNLMIHRGGAVTGMSMEYYQTVYTQTDYVIQGIGTEDQLTLMNNEFYVIRFPVLLEDLVLVNPGAELGTTSGWTITEGTLTVQTTLPYAGTSYFQSTTDTKYYQEVSIPGGYLTDIDAGKLMVSISCFVKETDTNSSQVSDINIYLECLDEVGALISTLPFDGVVSFSNIPEWLPHMSSVENIPPLTRTLRFRIELFASSTNSVCRVDDHSIKLWSVT